MTKVELRRKYFKEREKLGDSMRSTLSEEICARFLQYFNPVVGQSLHIFLPIAKFYEVDTNEIIRSCWSRGVAVYVPKVSGNEMISSQIFEDTRLIHSSWDIPEPEAVGSAEVINFDFVVTPLLICDAIGNRVGYGKGFYDRFFDTLSPTTKKIGLNYFFPEQKISDAGGYDVPVDYLVLPDRVLSFGNRTSKSTK